MRAKRNQVGVGSVGILAVLLALAGCGAGQPPRLDEPLGTGRVRAGVVTRPSELLGGPGAKGAIGDFKLYNSKVAFIVQAMGDARGWGPYGGGILDAARVDRNVDRLAEVIPGAAMTTVLLRALRPISARVLSDGQGGGAAVVRVESVDAPFPLFDAAIPTRIPPLHLRVSTDYVLEPDAEVLRVRSTFRYQGAAPAEIDITDGVILGDGLDFLAPGIGRRADDITGRSDIPLVVGASPGEVSYAWAAVGRSLRFAVGSNEVLPLIAATIPFAPGASATVERILAVGSGDAEEARRLALAALGAQPTARVEGTIVDGAGEPVPGAEVEVRRGDLPETVIAAGAAGRFSAVVAPGDVRLVVRAPGRADVVTSATAPATGLRIALPDGATLHLSVAGERADGSPEGLVPARVQVEPLEGQRGGLFYALPEETAIPLEPGRYRVTVSRGMEYEPDAQEVTLSPRMATSLAVTLRRVVDTTGFLAADFHLHAAPSIDSSLPLAERIRSCAGEGLEFAVATDHDVVTDYRPTIEALGLGRFLGSAPGTETSPLHGHVNGFPLRPDGRYWPVRWWRYRADDTFDRLYHPSEIFAALRGLGARVVQVNHGRSTSGVSGFMTSVGYDPARGYPSVDPAILDRNFDAFEVMNSRRTAAYEPQLTDWYSFVRQGHKVTAVATSDSHSASSSCGYPRTYVRAGDDPALATADAVADAVLAQRAVAAGGPFATISVGGRGLGEVAPAPGGDAEVAVRVQAPSFVGALRLALLVDGAEAAARDLPATGVVRFDGAIPVHVARDAFVTLKVTGDAPMVPVYNARPFTVTNPVYLDADGDGRYTPPGP